MIWKAIKYIYYNYYLFYKYKVLDYTPPQVTAVFVVAGLFVLWVATILGFTNLTVHEVIFLIFSLVSLAIWAYIFFHKSRWKEIIKEFENETEKQRKKGRRLCMLFTIFSIVMFVVSLFVLVIITS